MKIDTPQISCKFRKPFRSVLGFLGNPSSWDTILGSEHAYGGFHSHGATPQSSILNRIFVYISPKKHQLFGYHGHGKSSSKRMMILGDPHGLCHPWPMPPAAPRHPGTVEHFRCAPRGTDEFSWNMNGHQHSWNMKLWKIWSTTRLIHENIRLYIYTYIYIFIYFSI